jgi:hypothetical protein
MMQHTPVSVEFGTWQQANSEPETPVLVRFRTTTTEKKPSSQNSVLDLDSSSTTKGTPSTHKLTRAEGEMVGDNFDESKGQGRVAVAAATDTIKELVVTQGKEKEGSDGNLNRSRVTLANVTNNNFPDTTKDKRSLLPVILPKAVAQKGEDVDDIAAVTDQNQSKKKSEPPVLQNQQKKQGGNRRRQRTKNVIGRLKEDLQAQQESYQEAEKIAQNAERMASEVVQHSNIQLALMKEALEDAVQAENFAIEGWKISDETVSQMLGLLRERERLWARAMWKYAYHAVLNMNHSKKKKNDNKINNEQQNQEDSSLTSTWDEIANRNYVKSLKRSQKNRASKKLVKLEGRLDELINEISVVLNQ